MRPIKREKKFKEQKAIKELIYGQFARIGSYKRHSE